MAQLIKKSSESLTVVFKLLHKVNKHPTAGTDPKPPSFANTFGRAGKQQVFLPAEAIKGYF